MMTDKIHLFAATVACISALSIQQVIAQDVKIEDKLYKLPNNKYPVSIGEKSDNFFNLVVPASQHIMFASSASQTCGHPKNDGWSCTVRTFKKYNDDTTNYYISQPTGDKTIEESQMSTAFDNYLKTDNKEDSIDRQLMKTIFDATQKFAGTELKIIPRGRFPDDHKYTSGYCGGIILFYGTIRLFAFTSAKFSITNPGDFTSAMDNSHPVFSDAAICYGPVSPTPFNFEVNSGDMRRLTEALLIVSGRKPEEAATCPPTKAETKACAPAVEKAK